MGGLCSDDATLLFVSGTWFHYRTQGLSFRTLLFAGLAAIGLLGALETVIRRMVLAGDVLHVVDLWSHRSYPRAGIARVTYAKGSPVAVVFMDGRHVKLPHLGLSTLGVANSIRA